MPQSRGKEPEQVEKFRIKKSKEEVDEAEMEEVEVEGGV